MKFGVCVFPGSNCDYDTYYVIRDILGKPVRFINHTEKDIEDVDCVVIPGGFSFGDYLRAGALASKTPLAYAIQESAQKGKFVIGICNGFQILTELHLLPGALLRNDNLRFICKDVYLRVESTDTPFTKNFELGEVIRLPIAHGEGRYFVNQEELKVLEDNKQIVLRYCEQDGKITKEANPNGSVSNVAGVCNKDGNIFGLMPHPERACEDILGNHYGLLLWNSLLSSM